MIIDWITQHWFDIVQIYLGLVGIASIIVRLTPTPKDNEILKKITTFVGKFIALNKEI